MKYYALITFLLTTMLMQAQLKLEPQELKNLVAVGELYSKNPNATGKDFVKAIDSLRIPKLNHIVDVLLTVGKGDKAMMKAKILARPDDEELMCWYVIREIHYNRTDTTHTRKTSTEIAEEVLAQKIDSRWLVDNYYYRIHGGIALMFNDADLSSYNIDTDQLGLKDDTEKAIFYANMMDALAGGRFRVLRMMNNNKTLLEYCKKLPKFNGKAYYYYKNFDYPDFEWIGYDKKQSYKEVHLANLYNTLLAQFIATSELMSKQDAREIYFNSILREPSYFMYSMQKKELQALYDQSK